MERNFFGMTEQMQILYSSERYEIIWGSLKSVSMHLGGICRWMPLATKLMVLSGAKMIIKPFYY